jgi:hypothetical protein
MMDLTPVELLDLPQTKLAAVRLIIPRARIGEVMGPAIGAIFRTLGQQSVRVPYSHIISGSILMSLTLRSPFPSITRSLMMVKFVPRNFRRGASLELCTQVPTKDWLKHGSSLNLNLMHCD